MNDFVFRRVFVLYACSSIGFCVCSLERVYPSFSALFGDFILILPLLTTKQIHLQPRKAPLENTAPAYYHSVSFTFISGTAPTTWITTLSTFSLLAEGLLSILLSPLSLNPWIPHVCMRVCIYLKEKSLLHKDRLVLSDMYTSRKSIMSQKTFYKNFKII